MHRLRFRRRADGTMTRLAAAGWLALSALAAACGTFGDPPGTPASSTAGPTTAPSDPDTTLGDGVGTPPTTGSGVPPPLPEGSGLLLRADLTGPGAARPGDPDGRGRVIISSDGHEGEICYSLIVEAIGPVQALHVHRVGSPETLADLTNPDTGSERGCLEIAAEVVRALAATPAEFLVDVHTAEFPAGALGGTLNP